MSGVFGGGSATTSRNNQLASWGQLSDLGYFGQYGPGKGDITAGGQGIQGAQNFYNALLSGNPAATSQVLGPQISTIQQQGAQQKAVNQQFGTRSGGTAAASQMVDANTRAQINNLVATLTGGAAAGEVSAGQALGQLGTSTLSLGEQAANALGELAGKQYQTTKQQQNANLNALIGAIAGGVTGGIGGGGFAGALTGAAGTLGG